MTEPNHQLRADDALAPAPPRLEYEVKRRRSPAFWTILTTAVVVGLLIIGVAVFLYLLRLFM